jgi:RHS repeat-associated protein
MKTVRAICFTFLIFALYAASFGQETVYTYTGGGSLGSDAKDSVSPNDPHLKGVNQVVITLFFSNPLPPNSSIKCSDAPFWIVKDGASNVVLQSLTSGEGIEGYLNTNSSGKIVSWSVAAYIPGPGSVYDPEYTNYLEIGSNSGKYDYVIVADFQSVGGSDVPTQGFVKSAGPTGSWASAPFKIPVSSGGSPDDRPGQPSVSEPINVATGEVYSSTTDYTTAGPNRLAFERFYTSNVGSGAGPSMFGQAWRSSFDCSLLFDESIANLTIAFVPLITTPDGEVVYFNKNGTGWATDSDLNKSLVQSGNTWTFRDQHDVSYVFQQASGSSYAQLTSIKYLNGYSQKLSYDSNGKLSSVVDSYQRTLRFAYQNGLVSTVTTPDGLTLGYGYDFSDGGHSTFRLRSVSYSTNPATNQVYNYAVSAFPYALTSVVDENGNTFQTYTYDSQGRATSSFTSTGANLSQISYNDNDGSRTVTSPLGQEEVYRFAMFAGVPKVTEIDRLATATTAAAKESFTYDSNGYTSSQTDWNGVTTKFGNDSQGRCTSLTEAAGTSFARTTTTSYLGVTHLPVSIVAPGLTTTFTYDSLNEPLTKTLTDTTSQSTKGQKRTWTYTYSNSLLTSTKTPRTDVNGTTNYSYDSTGALIATKNALGQTTKITSHTPGGWPLTKIDANGVETAFTYDVRLRLLTRTVSTKSGNLVTSYIYDPVGDLLSTTLPDGSAIGRQYDGAHRLIAIIDLQSHEITYKLDLAGNQVQTSVLRTGGQLDSQRSATFDALGRLLTSVGGAGQTTTYAYDNNGNVDVLNRVVTTTDPLAAVTTTTYDVQDHPVSVALPNGSKTTYTYDGFGEVIQQKSSNTGTRVASFDADGNLLQSTDAASHKALYTYDALDRVKSVTYPNDTTENVKYSYDQTSEGFGVGRLTGLSDAAGTLTRSYDEQGNLLTEARVSGKISLTTNYTYDKANRILSITYPSGFMVSYARDNMGINRLISAHDGTQTIDIATVLQFTSFGAFNGPLRSITFGNGVSVSRLFDLDRRITNIQEVTKAGTAQNLSFTYDNNDNVSAVQDAIDSAQNLTYAYDLDDRVINASAGGYWTYDSNGNRLSKTTTNYTYTLDTDLLIDAQYKYGYTPTGNIATATGGSYTALTYNQANRLSSATLGGNIPIQYLYDGFGNRIKKSGNSQTEFFQYDQKQRLLEETDQNGHGITDYIYLDNGQLVGTISPSTGTVGFVTTDRIGTPTIVRGVNQNVLWSSTYTTFGNATWTGSITMNVRLPGQYSDAESGLSHNGFRDYDPTIGRYVESDPIGLLGGPNSYSYVGGNPIKNTDGLGLCSTDQLPAPAPVPPLPPSWSLEDLMKQITGYASLGSDYTLLVVDAASDLINKSIAGASVVLSGYDVYENPSFSNIVNLTANSIVLGANFLPPPLSKAFAIGFGVVEIGGTATTWLLIHTPILPWEARYDPTPTFGSNHG